MVLWRAVVWGRCGEQWFGDDVESSWTGEQ